MEEKLKKQTAIKFLETVKQGVSDLFISDSTINTLYSSLDELNKINNRKLTILFFIFYTHCKRILQICTLLLG